MSKFFPITTFGMDILRKETKKIQDVDTDLLMTITKMFDTMRNAEGIGLAAPQVNKQIALTVIDLSQNEGYEKSKPLTLINPVITGTHGKEFMEEGCLSIPGIRFEVERPSEIEFKFYDVDMKEHTMEADDLFARVVQHEIDHLHGKLFIDYLNDEEKKEIKGLLQDMRNKKVDAHYPLYIHAESY